MYLPIWTSLKERLKPLAGEKLCVLSQTTYNKRLWEQCREYIAQAMPDAEIFDTICSATATRQEEAEKLSLQADLMIIAGGKTALTPVSWRRFAKSTAAPYR